MKKERIVEALIAALRAELQQSIHASKEAAAYATDEESRAESKWDTQGLEASYLAAGQAGQARQWAEAISILEQNLPILRAPQRNVTTGALIQCDLAGKEEFFFISPVAGGEIVEVAEEEITIITMQSPILARLLGKRPGEPFTLANGVSGVILSVE